MCQECLHTLVCLLIVTESQKVVLSCCASRGNAIYFLHIEVWRLSHAHACVPEQCMYSIICMTRLYIVYYMCIIIILHGLLVVRRLSIAH